MLEMELRALYMLGKCLIVKKPPCPGFSSGEHEVSKVPAFLFSIVDFFAAVKVFLCQVTKVSHSWNVMALPAMPLKMPGMPSCLFAFLNFSSIPSPNSTC